MDVIPELLTSAFMSKTEASSKNNKQKNKHYKKQVLLEDKEVANESTDDETEVKLVQKNSNWDGVERRSNNDRRIKLLKRGRWLESRHKKDRRTSDKCISVTI